ncbi:MAG: thioesterase family protein [Nocardioidaceae bacterium]
MARGASVRIDRVVEWPDTDAAGHYHHSTVIRWVEAAEAALHERLGLLDLFGVVPRVRYEVDYSARLWFRDEVTIELTVAEVGNSSIRYEFEVRRGGESAARGAMVAVQLDPDSGAPLAWSDEFRDLLLDSHNG